MEENRPATAGATESMDTKVKEEYKREEKLIGTDGIEKLRNSSVLVLGAGGVGSYVIEALARAGVGRIDVLDRDVVDRSNINRQLIALNSTVGRKKVDVVRERLMDIDPDIRCDTFCLTFSQDCGEPDFSRYDYVVDAVDSVGAKVEAAVRAAEAGIGIISIMGTGNKMDPMAFSVADINDTKVCPLARAVRRKLRDTAVKDLTVVYSEEEPVREGDRTPSSVSFVPSAAGLLAASCVIKGLLEYGSGGNKHNRIIDEK